MHIRIVGLFIAAAAVCTACNGPGSPEWCKGVLTGTIQATPAEVEANSDKCEAEMMKSMTGGKLPGT